jgi:ribosome-binding ATPase YchF (GTP1/OBG family)
VRVAYDLLDLVTFFTAHRGAEARARALRRGLTAWDAAGKVHTDIQAGFVRAEVIDWRELVAAGGYGAARERGLIRSEGRDYLVRDGDVIDIRH